MKTLRGLVAVCVLIFAAPFVAAQDFPKPGPEHEMLKKWVGTWDTTMKMAGMESKGTATYKMCETLLDLRLAQSKLAFVSPEQISPELFVRIGTPMIWHSA